MNKIKIIIVSFLLFCFPFLILAAEEEKSLSNSESFNAEVIEVVKEEKLVCRMEVFPFSKI